MAKAARDTLGRLLAEAAVEPDGVPDAVVSLQTCGSFGVNFHPHLHVLATDGVSTRDGCFPPVVWPEEAALEECFRRLFLERLEGAGRRRPETGRWSWWVRWGCCAFRCLDDLGAGRLIP